MTVVKDGEAGAVEVGEPLVYHARVVLVVT